MFYRPNMIKRPQLKSTDQMNWFLQRVN